MSRLPLELIERLRALRPKAETPPDHVGFVATAAGVYFLIAAAIEVWRFIAVDIVGPIWRLVRPWLLVVAMIVMPQYAEAAVEARCTELGANCFCSEPLNTNSYPTFSGFWQDPGDTSGGDKQCTMLGGTAGKAFENGGLHVFGANSGAAWSALPAGHTLSWIARGPDNHTTTLLGDVGPGTPASSNGLKVRAARFYVFWSSTYDFAGDGTCTNSKLSQIVGGGGSQVHVKHITGGNPNDGGFPFWGPLFQDCCGGPWPDAWASDDAKGYWWRVEEHIINPVGGTGSNSARYRTFIKNVTLNLAEVRITDTDVSAGGWTASANTKVGSQASSNDDYFNGVHASQFRSGPECGGHNAWSHFMYAMWDTDTGQRIGAASEIEGGAAPRGFILRSLIPLLFVIGLSLAAWRAHVVVG